MFSFVRTPPRAKVTTKIHPWAETVVGARQPWLVFGQGVGAVIGALTLPALARRTSRIYVLRASLGTVVIADAAYGLAPNLVLAVLALVLLGGAYVGTLTGLNTSVQLHAPRSERSRILALYTLSLSLGYPLGALVQAAIAKDWGVRQITVTGAALMGIIMIAVTLAYPQ